MARYARYVRYALITLAGLGAAAGTALATGVWLGEQKASRRFEVAVQGVAVPGDAAAIEHGRYLFNSRGCIDCHGRDGGGRVLVDGGGVKIAGPHIGNGAGSVTARYEVTDWDRSIRHGVAPSGRPLRVMPSQDYNRLTDADLGALVAYLKQLPPAEGGGAVLQFPMLVRALYGFGAIPDAASMIDHSLPPEKPVAEGATVEHGRYVAQMCKGCHGDHYGGGKIPGGPPDWPASANLTPGEGSVMGRYTDAGAFMRMMKSGQRPDGSRVAVMPFESLAAMSDVDLEAAYRYLKTLPPRVAGTR